MNLEITPIRARVGVAGIYTLDAIKRDESGRVTESRRLAGPFHNLITDEGLELLGTDGVFTILQYCHVGTGSTPPAFTDTTLDAFLAESNTSAGGENQVYVAGPPAYIRSSKIYEFAAGVAAGNLTEVGVGRPNAESKLFSHALIVDGGGSPTVIPIQPNEILRVTFELRLYPPELDFIDTIQISGNDYDITVRPQKVNTYAQFGAGWGFGPSENRTSALRPSNVTGAQQAKSGGDLGPQTGIPTGTNVSGVVGSSTDAYVPASHQRTAQITWGINATQNIRTVEYAFGWCAYQVKFVPDIPKTGSNQLTLDFVHSWERYTP